LAVTGGYVPERMVVAVDGRVFAFTLAVSCVAGVVFGLVPALQASQVDLNEGLRASSPASTGGVRRRRVSRLLIVSELAISVVLLVGCGLMIRSFLRVEASTGGIVVDQLLETQSEGGRSFSEALTFWRLVLDRVQQDRGVEAAAVTSRPPVHGSRRQTFSIEGHQSAGVDMRAGDILISEDYFTTMGIPLVKGRAFSAMDSGGSTAVAIISESLARTYFANEDPIGKRLMLSERTPMLCCASAGPVENVWREIVAVAADVRQGSLDEQPATTIYRPYSQIVEHDMYLMVRARSAAEASRLAIQLGPLLKTVDRSREWADVRRMQDVIRDSESVRLRRFVLILFAIFAGLAIVLAAVGTYGVMSYAVADRTREIGIRMALGATRSTVIHHVVSDTLRLALVGLLIGWFAAQGLSRFMTSMLFGVTPGDTVTYVGVSCVLAGVSFLAGYVPARRASTIDPLAALKQE
jgi:predicted permease